MPKSVAAFGEVMMRLKTPGRDLLTQSDQLQVSYSGSGVNVLAALARFGHSSALVTTLPGNAVGDAALAGIARLGLSPSLVRRGGDYIGMYFLEEGFGPRPSRVTYGNRLASSFNTAPAGAYDFRAVARAVDAVHLCGISLAMNDTVRAHAVELAEAVKAEGGTVIFDCNFRPGLWGENGHALARPWYEKMLHLADIALMNERDAVYTLGMSASGTGRDEQLRELIPRVAAEYGLAAAAGTHRYVGTDGLHSLCGYLYTPQGFSFSETYTFPVHDRIGAGDAFASGIIHGLLEGQPPEWTVAFAASASVLAHTISGDTPLTSEAQILRFMAGAGADLER